MSTRHQYLTRIFWSAEDDAFVAEVPDLPGCVSHGETVTEAAANIEEAVELWLESARKHGDEVPESDPVRARLTEIGPLLNVSELARRSGLKRSTLVTKLKRRTRFTTEESSALRSVLDSM